MRGLITRNRFFIDEDGETKKVLNIQNANHYDLKEKHLVITIMDNQEEVSVALKYILPEEDSDSTKGIGWYTNRKGEKVCLMSISHSAGETNYCGEISSVIHFLLDNQKEVQLKTISRMK